MLKAALDELWNEGYKFSLNVYFTPTELSPYMNIHGRYSYDELEAIMDSSVERLFAGYAPLIKENNHKLKYKVLTRV